MHRNARKTKRTQSNAHFNANRSRKLYAPPESGMKKSRCRA
ncbi:hypothetical protein PJE062_638 [Pseudovibrio sp. JE062]|nr:hypothetical protein PJE062_638 [Pseudovibrio sp. JE062]